ncbi:MAG: IPT/TIG domain-containing protein, partial [Candidatus Geothermincolia bacterium]
GTSSVSFGATAVAIYVSWSDTQAVVQVPAGLSGVVNITLTTAGGASNALAFSVTPYISAPTPTSGTVGTSVSLEGNGFGAAQGTSTVSFGSVPVAGYSSWSDTAVAVLVPAGAAGATQITLTTTGGTSGGVNFSVTPYLDTMLQASGFVTTEVALTGTGFGATQGSSYVSFGTEAATVYTSWSDTQIVCQVPVASPGVVSVTVTTSGGTSNGKDFTVTAYMLTSLTTWNYDATPGGGNIAFGTIFAGTTVDHTAPAARLTVTSTVPYVSTVHATGAFQDGLGHELPWSSFFWSAHGLGTWTAFSTSPVQCASGSATWPESSSHDFDYRIQAQSNQAPGSYQVTVRYTTYQP